ncbi:MAG: chorismate mutase [bacterium]
MNKPPFQKKLEALREEIDGIDAQLLKLLNRRIEIAREIGALKKTHGEPVCDPHREQKILECLERQNKETGGVLSTEDLRAIYQALLDASRGVQHQLINKRQP